jgi:hypothetical protein
MNESSVRHEAWSVWARVTVVMLAVLTILITLPWIFMWTAMASLCMPMMNGIGGMMTPGMMR